MTFTLKQIVESMEGLNALLAIKLPIKISYRLSKLNNKLKSELALYEESRIALIKRLGEQTNTQMDSWQVKPENIQDYTTEFKKLQEEVVEIDFTPLTLEEIGNIEVSPKDIPEWLFEE